MQYRNKRYMVILKYLKTYVNEWNHVCPHQRASCYLLLSDTRRERQGHHEDATMR